MRPIFHLSIPVRDLDEAVAFYCDDLGAQLGRRTQTFADVLLFGAQLTLQNDPRNVINPMPRTRHFGATISWAQWETTADEIPSDAFIETPTISYEGDLA